jgi:hypothetical protein
VLPAAGADSQAVELAEHLVGGLTRQHHSGIVAHEIEPALTARLAEQLRPLRKQPRHRMIVTAEQRAEDEEMVGGQAAASSRDARTKYTSRHCEA